MKISRYILFVLITTFFLLIVYGLQNIIVLKLEIHKNDTGNLLDYYLDEGAESVELSDDIKDYKIELKSSKNEVLYVKYFQPTFDILIDPLPGQEIPYNGISLDKVTMILKLNYPSKVEILEIYHRDKRVLLADIELCNNNNICEANKKENYLSCPSDCLSGSRDSYCDRILDRICDPDCIVKELDIDCTCGNKICDARENEKTCKIDCRLSWWQRFINWLKTIWG